jgi:hypothetical protein
MSSDSDAAPDGHILPANVDDPRFAASPAPQADNREWTDTDAVFAQVTMPLDDAKMVVASELLGERSLVWLIVELLTTAVRWLVRWP